MDATFLFDYPYEACTRAAGETLTLAQEQAERSQWHQIGTTHLLMGLIQQSGTLAVEVMQRVGSARVAHRPTREEVVLVLDGEPHLTLDGVSAELHRGDAAIMHANSELRVDAGLAGATAWVTTTPVLEAVPADGSR